MHAKTYESRCQKFTLLNLNTHFVEYQHLIRNVEIPFICIQHFFKYIIQHFIQPSFNILEKLIQQI